MPERRKEPLWEWKEEEEANIHSILLVHPQPPVLPAFPLLTPLSWSIKHWDGTEPSSPSVTSLSHVAFSIFSVLVRPRFACLAHSCPSSRLTQLTIQFLSVGHL